MRAHGAFQSLPGTVERCDANSQAFCDAGNGFAVDCAQKRVLGSEVNVDSPRGHTARGGDLAHCGLVITAMGEQMGRGIAKFQAAIVGT